MQSIPISVGKKLEKLYRERIQHGEWKDWLPVDFDYGFVCCIGAGPWTLKRRYDVQEAAMNWYRSNEPMEFIGERQLQVSCYPLQWQNSMLERMCRYLYDGGWTMESFGYALIGLAEKEMWSDALHVLHHAANNGRRTKVVSLYARDFLKIPAFPIDRHVKRVLVANGLPTKEDVLISECLDYGLDPCRVARSLFYASVSSGNPAHNSE